MLEAGIRIGGLMIHEMVGRGAMGEVYRGEQISLRRPVAVKRIASHLADDASLLARFEREARLVATLQSPHVVAIYDFGQFPDQHGQLHALLVMEWVEGGRNLRHLVGADQALPWQTATALIRDVCRGLVAAHEQDIVHRDIKPDNILLNRNGLAKLADFGLAVGADTTAMTQAGAMIGTPDYMPPEACEGEKVGIAGDIYSLGATWFHLLAGRPPFVADKLIAVLRAHCDTPAPEILDLEPEVPPQIAALVAACLAKPIDARPASAKSLLERIEALAAEGLTLPETCRGLITDAPSGNDTMSPTAPTVLADTTAPTAPTAPLAATTVPPTDPTPASHAATRISEPPPAAPPRSRGLFFSAGAVIVILAIGGTIFALQSNPLQEGIDQVASALSAGDKGRALATADHLVATYPNAAEAHAAVAEVIQAEVDHLVTQQRFDDALALIETRKNERAYLTTDDIDREVRLAKARHLRANEYYRDSDDAYIDVLKRYPTALDIRYAHLEDFGASSDELKTNRNAIYSAWDIAKATEGPLDKIVGDTLIAGLRWLSNWDDFTTEVRVALGLRYREATVAQAHNWLEDDEIERRFVGYAMLRDANALDDATEVRFHSWVLFGPGDRWSYQWDVSRPWLESAIADSTWAERLAASKWSLPQEAPEFLDKWSDKQRYALELMVAGYRSLVEQALPAWLNQEQDTIRWNAFLLTDLVGRPDLVDLDSFHRQSLVTYDRSYQTRGAKAAISHFALHPDRQLATEALNAGKAYVQDWIDRVTAAGNADRLGNANYIMNAINDALAGKPIEE